MTMVLEVTVGAELPDRTLTWESSAGVAINFTTDPHTFTLEVKTSTPIVKTAGITGAGAAPNVTITFTSGETDSWPVGAYAALLWAKRTSDGKDREPIPIHVRVKPTIT